MFLLVVDNELEDADSRVQTVAAAIVDGLDVGDVPRAYLGERPDAWHAGLVSEIWHVATAEPSVRHRLETHRNKRFERLATAAIDAGDVLSEAKNRANIASRMIDAAIVEAQLEAASEGVA